MKKNNSDILCIRSNYRIPKSVMQHSVEGVRVSMTPGAMIDVDFYHNEHDLPEYSYEYLDENGDIVNRENHYAGLNGQTPQDLRIITNRIRLSHDTAVELKELLSNNIQVLKKVRSQARTQDEKQDGQ
ncbi:MAG: hypothetical protein K5657_05195 [Desulfovibrio sp.]|nr:hypothetical protein [Desulfovibrio sp.]